MTLIRRLLITCNDSSGMIDHFEDPLPRAALDWNGPSWLTFIEHMKDSL
jgi:hypothetical protein